MRLVAAVTCIPLIVTVPTKSDTAAAAAPSEDTVPAEERLNPSADRIGHPYREDAAVSNARQQRAGKSR